MGTNGWREGCKIDGRMRDKQMNGWVEEWVGGLMLEVRWMDDGKMDR